MTKTTQNDMCDVGESLEVGNFLNDDSGVLKCIEV